MSTSATGSPRTDESGGVAGVSFESRRPRRRPSLAPTIVVGVLLAAAVACGSNGETTTTSQTTAQQTTPSTVAPPTSTVTTTTTAAPATSPAPSTSSPIGVSRREMLTRILREHQDAGELVGARITLRDRDGTVTEVSAGTQTTDPASPLVDLAVPWGIGSATKTVVAVVALQLAQEGRIDLDAGIDRYLPDLAGVDEITPRQLLQHTSGLGEYLDKPAVVDDARRPWTPPELIAVAEASGRVGEPGGPYHYSNTNYIVLGVIIEHVTGNSWIDEARNRIFGPLGMDSTGLIGTEIALGYALVDGAFVETARSRDPSLGGAAGGLQSTNHDLLLFATALAEGTLLSPDSQTAMLTFVPGDDLSQFGVEHSYGLGLERYAIDDITVYGHLGSGTGHSSFFGFDTDDDTAVVVTMNSDNAGPQALMAIEALVAASTAG